MQTQAPLASKLPVCGDLLSQMTTSGVSTVLRPPLTKLLHVNHRHRLEMLVRKGQHTAEGKQPMGSNLHMRSLSAVRRTEHARTARLSTAPHLLTATTVGGDGRQIMGDAPLRASRPCAVICQHSCRLSAVSAVSAPTPARPASATL